MTVELCQRSRELLCFQCKEGEMKTAIKEYCLICYYTAWATVMFQQLKGMQINI